MALQNPLLKVKEFGQSIWLDYLSRTLIGSPREFDRTRILGCFLEDHKFGPGRGHALSLQEQIA
jgi:hypothetical protein